MKTPISVLLRTSLFTFLLLPQLASAAEWKTSIVIKSLNGIFGDSKCESSLESGRPALDIIPVDAQIDGDLLKIVLQAVSKKCDFQAGQFPFVERKFRSVVKAYSKAAQPVELAVAKTYFTLSGGNGVERGIVPTGDGVTQEISFTIPMNEISAQGSIVPFALNLKAESMAGKIGDIALTAHDVALATKEFKVVIDEEAFEAYIDTN